MLRDLGLVVTLGFASLVFVGCGGDHDGPSLPPIDSLSEKNDVLTASERVSVGAITLTANATPERVAGGCRVDVNVTQSASDGVVYDPFDQNYELDREYVVRGSGAWSWSPERATGPSTELHAVANGVPALNAEADVVVRLVDKSNTRLYLAKRRVSFACGG
jgi:hypothetical protein